MKQVFLLTETLSRQQSTIKELQKEVRDLSQTVNDDVRRLQSSVERLAVEIQRMREQEVAERKIIKLELGNHLLRVERGLPPAPISEN